MDLTGLGLVVRLADGPEVALLVQLDIAVKPHLSVLVLGVLGVFVLDPAHHHVFVVHGVQILHTGRLQTDVVFVQELAFGLGFDVAAEQQQIVLALLLSLEDLLGTRLEGLVAGAACIVRDFGHFVSLRDEKRYLLIPGLLLVDDCRFLCQFVSLVFKCLRLRLRCEHLRRRLLAKVDVCDFVFVLVFLAGQKLQQP